MAESEETSMPDAKATTREKLKAKASETASVRGRTMSKAEIFKFAGLVAFFILVAISCVFLWPYVHDIFEPGGIDRVTADVRAAGFGGVAILLGIQFLQTVVAFIPGEVVQVAAGMIYGPWFGAFVLLLGCLISNAFVYVLVHKLGAPFVQAMVSQKYMDKFKAFEKSGKLNVIVFIIYLIPGLPKDVFTYLTPLSHMPLHTFLTLSTIARIPGILVSTYAAASLVSGDIITSIVIFAIAGAVAVAGIVGYDKIMKRVEAKTGKEHLHLKDYES